MLNGEKGTIGLTRDPERKVGGYAGRGTIAPTACAHCVPRALRCMERVVPSPRRLILIASAASMSAEHGFAVPHEIACIH